MSKSKQWGVATTVAGICIIFALVLFRLNSTVGLVKSSTVTTQIGVILPLTGAAAALGKATQNGMRLAFAEHNSERKPEEPQIETIIEDDRADPATSVSALQKLISADGARVVLGPLTSGTTLAVAPIAERYRVVVISPGASAPAVTAAGDYIFRVELSESVGARMQAELAVSPLNINRIAMLYVNNEYGVGTANVFRARFSELGGQVLIAEAFPPNAVDFRTALQKIKEANPDAMFVVFQDSILNIIKQRAELNVSVPLLTTPVFEDPSNLKALGSLAEGVVYSYYGNFNAAATTGLGSQFSRRFQERYREPATYYAALGYDAARVLMAAFRAALYDVGGIKNALYNIRDFPGVTGTLSLDRNGDVVKPVILKTVRNGQFVFY